MGQQNQIGNSMDMNDEAKNLISEWHESKNQGWGWSLQSSPNWEHLSSSPTSSSPSPLPSSWSPHHDLHHHHQGDNLVIKRAELFAPKATASWKFPNWLNISLKKIYYIIRYIEMIYYSDIFIRSMFQIYSPLQCSFWNVDSFCPWSIWLWKPIVCS